MKKYILEFLAVAVVLALIYWLASPELTPIEMYKTKTVFLSGGGNDSVVVNRDSMILLNKDSQGKSRQVGLVNLKMFMQLASKTRHVEVQEFGGNVIRIKAKSANDLFGQDGRKWYNRYKKSLEYLQDDKHSNSEEDNDGREIYVRIVDTLDKEYIRIPYQILEVIANTVK